MSRFAFSTAVLLGLGSALFAQFPPASPFANPNYFANERRARQMTSFYTAVHEAYLRRSRVPRMEIVAEAIHRGEVYYRRNLAPAAEPNLFVPPQDEPPEPQYIAADGPLATSALQAQVTLEVPALAHVWVEGKKQEFRGTAVRIVSPDLDPDRFYAYAVRVEWLDGKNTVERTFDVSIAAGDRKVVTVVGKSK